MGARVMGQWLEADFVSPRLKLVRRIQINGRDRSGQHSAHAGSKNPGPGPGCGLGRGGARLRAGPWAAFLLYWAEMATNIVKHNFSFVLFF